MLLIYIYSKDTPMSQMLPVLICLICISAIPKQTFMDALLTAFTEATRYDKSTVSVELKQRVNSFTCQLTENE